MLIYNTVSGSLGTPHRHHCGIPQGCPFSMTFISLYLRAWIQQMVAAHAEPRTLADDVLLITKGRRALHIFHHAFNLTITHLIDIGGRLAPHKSNIFSTIDTHRAWLKNCIWQHVNQTIPIVHHIRDLGSSLCSTYSYSTFMSRNRLQSALATLYKIQKLPHPKHIKCKFIRTSAHSRGLYGCENSHVDETLLKRRLAMFRKMLEKYTYIHDLVSVIYHKYKDMLFPGTNFTQSHLGTVEPSPVPGGPGRSQGSSRLDACGP
eukprot:5157762-Karenia_brevis.AAC.1